MLFCLQVTSKLAHFGATLDPHAAFLLARGLATLGLRVRQQNKTGQAVADFLFNHPLVSHSQLLSSQLLPALTG